MKRIPQSKKYRQWLADVEHELQTSLGRLEFDAYSHFRRLSYRADTLKERKLYAELANASFMNIMRAERDSDRAVLRELRDRLDGTSDDVLEDL